MIKDKAAVKELMSYFENLTFVKYMPCDTKHTSKHAMFLSEKSMFVWFDDERADNRGRLILLYPDDKFDIIWFTYFHSYIGCGKYENNPSLLNYLDRLFQSKQSN